MRGHVSMRRYDDGIPYDIVTRKLNDWYTAIRNNLDKEATSLKKEVEKFIGRVDKNSDVFFYHQLLEFRHELMLSYLKSKNEEDLKNAYEALKEHQGHLKGMLDYYFFFFTGMYEFRRKKLVAAISAYRRAEKSLEFVDDEIEHAEFYYKMAEIFYYMKQTYFSLDYVKRAIRIYNKYDNYIDRVLRCQYVVAGNLIDSLDYKGALEMFEETLKIAKKTGRQLLIATSKLNIGICYNLIGEYEKSYKSLIEANEFFKKENHACVEKTLFNLAHVQAKRGEKESAKSYYEKGYAVALERKNSEYIVKLDLLKALYLKEGCYNLIDESFSFFRERKMYGDIEEFGFEVAEVFQKKGDTDRSAFYYRQVILAKNQIQKGEMIYETQIDDLIIGSDSGVGYYGDK
ncbi:tetratricopeptide repeat protein [Bacillus glycinifermentans]|uniref:Aspartate phosphatase n=1 Tax=Bacillus glycinifermentans TaxID=1664069 RepID=A0A0T6BVB5_9BACI|nr:tetratricopeptide repeat protein [Bacillus glycinifermentans]ATH94155.1 tetratricopeptide repeat-containing protein [Bacillus glycinifermentans]KRT95584.1 aspartate phosphatase [Bacillus glycinifermentans]MEC0484544.1 tetratricopeptide repeat protein [Bacillus glycinifermentans]MEC0496567.1 tetratricopeptide repeat protein [Bacillus glycinifermentans]MEC0542981.1 tetratricopeptide repeat protein [Bacillus glycinifermentans]